MFDKKNKLCAESSNVDLGIDFLEDDPDNVYRTKNYIVAQHISLAYDNSVGAVSVSEDFYFKRNTARDDDYEYMVEKGHYPNGRRVPTQSHVRTYVD